MLTTSGLKQAHIPVRIGERKVPYCAGAAGGSPKRYGCLSSCLPVVLGTVLSVGRRVLAEIARPV